METTPGVTQRGLAERMGVNPAAVNRMLYGRRNIMADEVPVIEAYLGVKLDLGEARGRPGEYRQERRAAMARGFSDVQHSGIDDGDVPPDVPPVPVYASARGGNIVDWVPRHPLQLAVRDAYALFVASEDMQPRYYRGETVYVHPAKPVMTGMDCVIERRDGEVLLRRLVQKTDDRLTVQQFHPAKLVEISLADVAALYSIIGRS